MFVVRLAEDLPAAVNGRFQRWTFSTAAPAIDFARSLTKLLRPGGQVLVRQDASVNAVGGPEPDAPTAPGVNDLAFAERHSRTGEWTWFGDDLRP